VERTPFRETHYKKLLAGLEEDRRVEVVQAKGGRRRGTFADGAMRIRFAR
jgi:hypothetical protein